MDILHLLTEKQELLRSQFPAFPHVNEVPELTSDAEVIENHDDVAAFAQPIYKDEAIWGKNCWIAHANYGVADSQWIKPLFSGLAARQFQRGVRNFYVEAIASDSKELQAWFELGFGLQHALAIKTTPPVLENISEVSVRRAQRRDIPTMAVLEQELSLYQMGSPVFSPTKPEPLEDIIREWEAEIDNPEYSVFVAENENKVVALSYGCSTEKSSAHSGLLRPHNSATLAFCVVDSHFRGSGIGLKLANRVLLDLADKGFQNFVTDWRVTNQLSSRTWPKLGFTPTIYRLMRTV